MTFAAQLKQARHAAGLSQSQVAALLGVTAQSVYYWESGKRVPPSEPVLTQSAILSAIKAIEATSPG